MKTSKTTGALAFAIFALLAGRPAFAAPQARASAAANAAEPPAIQNLHLKETTVFPSGVPFAFGDSHCDSSGDIFLSLSKYGLRETGAASEPVITEVTPESKQMQEYEKTPISIADYPNPLRLGFAVTPRGVIYRAFLTLRSPTPPRPPAEFYVEKFNDDGTTDSITHLDAPAETSQWFPQTFAVFPDGNLLVVGAGSPIEEQPEGSRWVPLLAIYGPGGRFVRDLSLPNDSDNETGESNSVTEKAVKDTPGSSKEKIAAPSQDTSSGAATPKAEASPTISQASLHGRNLVQAISDGGVAVAPDGNAWIALATDPIRLFEVDSGGEVIKHFQIAPPLKGMQRFIIGLAGPGKVYFDFAPVELDSRKIYGKSEVLGVFNTESERFEGVYKLPETETGLRFPVCSDLHGGFLYVGATSDNHFAVFDYVP